MRRASPWLFRKSFIRNTRIRSWTTWPPTWTGCLCKIFPLSSHWGSPRSWFRWRNKRWYTLRCRMRSRVAGLRSRLSPKLTRNPTFNSTSKKLTWISHSNTLSLLSQSGSRIKAQVELVFVDSQYPWSWHPMPQLTANCRLTSHRKLATSLKCTTIRSTCRDRQISPRHSTL